VLVRVIEYRLAGVPGAKPVYRLLTTILDPAAAPAADLAALYQERWEIETAFDELKTHLRGARIVLRSKTPDLVTQEFYGLLLAHFAVRGLLREAALQAGEDPDRLSFLHAVQVIRRKLAGFVALPPPADRNAFHAAVLREILDERVGSSRSRCNPLRVKRTDEQVSSAAPDAHRDDVAPEFCFGTAGTPVRNPSICQGSCLHRPSRPPERYSAQC
jgi:hypothetical protein